jgi:tetratricopeptide (TPR) repeat protein
MSVSTHAPETLAIQHLPGSDPASFRVVRLRDRKCSPPIPVISPVRFPVEGRPNSHLLRELQWYLETFLEYPFPPETEHADRVLKSLRTWGEQTFRALFDVSAAGRFVDESTRDYSKLHLQISSDDPRVLAWPWEALRDPEIGFLGQLCQVVRQLNTARNPQELSESLSNDRVNILLVVSRPFERDVRFRSVARPLVELIEQEKLPASVEVLRPPTFDQLRAHLRKRQGYYHILHFDGHGAYSTGTPSGAIDTFRGPEGKLVFETEDGEADPVSSEKLSALLQECAVPGVVLNACQSAMTAADSNDPFASVAIALLRSGMRDVVAMAYSLYVSGAQRFLPVFYRRFFEEGSMAIAVKAGRQEMWQHDKRACVRGEFPLQDWLLPVLYQQDPLNFAFATKSGNGKTPAYESKLPTELRRERNPYGFIGRDSAILELERAMRRDPAGVLIQGFSGVGKTTLARGFLQWLDQTGGLTNPPLWFPFQEIRSAEFVFNRMGEAIFEQEFPTLPMEKKIEVLARNLLAQSFVIVWDNFESAHGIEGTAVEANLSESDRDLLAQLLDELRGGKTKVIITSRSPEEWLGPHRRFLLSLGGLNNEERWEYCNAILRDLGKKVSRDDSHMVELMDQLSGHPLAMRVILPSLEKMGPRQILAALQSDISTLKLEGDFEQAKLYGSVAFVEQSLSEELRPLLTLVGMHEEFVSADLLPTMAAAANASWSRSKIHTLLQALVSAGLLQEVLHGIYQMHPLLTNYLRLEQIRRTDSASSDACARAFVAVIGLVANQLMKKEFHEQRLAFHWNGQNFYYALKQAERLGMSDHLAALTEILAAFALNSKDFATSRRLYLRFAELRKSAGDRQGEAVAYHQLGTIDVEERNFEAAEQWCRKSLDITEEIGRTSEAASTYLSLGNIAQNRRDFAAAERWYQKSLAVGQQFGNELLTARVYHELGITAQEQRDFASAEQWYHKSLDINEKLRDDSLAVLIYHRLGVISQEQRNFAAAEDWYRKSLAIKERIGDERGAAITYHQLGAMAQGRSDFDTAGQMYRKSLAIHERINDYRSAAVTYHQLGTVALEQRDFGAAEQWCRKSLAKKEELADEAGVANSCHNLGIIFQEQHQFAAAEQWYRKSLAIRERLGDRHGAGQSYGQLGTLAGERGHFVESGQWLIDALHAFIQTRDLDSLAMTLQNFVALYHQARPDQQDKLKVMLADAGLGDLSKNDPAS